MADFASAIEALWQQQAPIVAERLEVLHRFVGGDEDSREEARQVAHKLTGALGSYGRARGSEISRELERLIETGTPAGQLAGLVEELDSVVR